MTLLLIQAAATLALVGLIWTIQLVHYPLLSSVGGASFEQYHDQHTRRMTWLVGPLMPTELLASIWIVLAPPAGVSPTLAWMGLGLVLLIWGITAFVSVPAHQRLAQGFDLEAHTRLVQTNWIRTIAWTARGALAIWMIVAHTR